MISPGSQKPLEFRGEQLLTFYFTTMLLIKLFVACPRSEHQNAQEWL